MRVIFRETAKEIPMPERIQEIHRFLWELCSWGVKFFRLVALYMELYMLLMLMEKVQPLQKVAQLKSRLVNLADGTILLSDGTECDIV